MSDTPKTDTREPVYHGLCLCGHAYDLPLTWSNTTCDDCGRTLPGQFTPRAWSNYQLRHTLTSIRRAIFMVGPLSNDPRFGEESYERMLALVQEMSAAFLPLPSEAPK